jgi:carboxypeptidase Q
MRSISLFAVALGLGSTCLPGQKATDLSVVHQIKTEAFHNSKVMDHLASLSDLYGPRLTASPEWGEAAQWAEKELKSYGLANVHEESWGPFGKSWSVESYTVDMLTPRYSHLTAAPLAWSSPTKGVETGEAVYAPLTLGRWFELKKGREEFEKYKTRWHGKLKDKIVLISDEKPPTPAAGPLFTRYSDAQLADIAKAPVPAKRLTLTVDQLDIPSDPAEAGRYLATVPNTVMDDFYERYNDFSADLGVFFKEEGVAGVIRADPRSHNGSVNAEQAGSFTSKKPAAPPTFVVTEEQYSRMQRLLIKKQPVTLGINLKAKISERDVDGANIIAEIPGTKKPEEVVMIGAHFDSWHSGTGATDNGAGSAVMIEVMRILTALHLPLERTVRIGLWSGEEQGLFGSRAYIQQHYADVKTGEVKPEQAKFDAYLNLDNGSGKIRGIYLEENDAIRPLFEAWLAPFRDMGATTVTGQHTTGTDHQSFDDAGLPGFQFIQDPLDYGTLSHHSNVDTYSHAVPEDLMQASAVIAALVYDIANHDQLVPRKSSVRDGKLVSY